MSSQSVRARMTLREFVIVRLQDLALLCAYLLTLSLLASCATPTVLQTPVPKLPDQLTKPPLPFPKPPTQR